MNEKKLKKYFLLVILIIILLIIYGVYLLTNNEKIVKDSSKNIVYTYYENSDYNQKIPNVNINKLDKKINDSIIEFTNNFKDSKTASISYQYSLSGNILSLLITVEDSKYEGSPDVSFKSYIIDLKKLKILNDNQVLKLFDTDKKSVVEEMDNRFKKYYKEEIDKKIISNMTYKEYMDKRNLNNIGDNIYLYIEDAKLNVYLDYNLFIAEEKTYYLANIGYKFEMS